MANLTIALDDDLLRKARVRAAELGTSVNAVLREQLAAFAGEGVTRRTAVTALLELARGARAGSGGRKWRRADLHER